MKRNRQDDTGDGPAQLRGGLRNAAYWLDYGFAAFCVAGAIGLRLALDPLLGPHFYFSTLFFAVLLAAWYGGLGPALAAVALGALASIYFLLPPRGSFALAGQEEHAGLVLYLLTGLGIAALGGAMRQAQRQADAARRESEARYNTLFQYAPDGILIADMQSNYRDANASACRMFGYAHDEFVSRNARDIVVPAEIPHIGQALDTIKAKAAYQREWKFRRKDDSVFDADVIATMMPDGNLLAVIRDITERKQAEHAALQLANIVTYSDDAIIGKDLHSIVTSWNRGAERIFGYPAAEMIGASIARLIPANRQPEEEVIMARIRQGESVEHFETLRMTKAGKIIDVSVTVSPIKDAAGQIIGASKIARDITTQKQTEEGLRTSRQEFKDLFDQAPIGIHEVDGQGRLVRINQTELKMLGYTAEELLGRFVWEISAEPAVSKSAVLAKLKGVMPQAVFERSLQRKDGLAFPVAIEDRIIKDKTGAITGIFSVMQDITERKQAEVEIRGLNASLERRVAERTAQLEAANKELEAFSYSVSHDLRAPLRAVDGFAQAVIEDYAPLLPEEGRHFLRTIREGAQKMGVLIDDLLAFSRLSRQPLNKYAVDTRHLVQEAWEQLEPQRQGRRCEFTLGTLAPCRGDPALLKQVWLNLLSNALKYSRARPVAVIEAGSREEPDAVSYFVRDNGTGFDMAYAHKLFGVFQRLHRADEYEGTGVGLAIVQRIVRRHGGRVWAEAAPDQGATFYFTLQGGAADE